MAGDARMTVRLDSATRRKLERAAAARWLEDAINDREPLGLAWPTIRQFLRLGTNPAFPGCMSDDEALGFVDEWLDAGVVLLGDDELDWHLLVELAAVSERALLDVIDDAHLAALAISRGATLASFDVDFEIFRESGLRLERLASGR